MTISKEASGGYYKIRVYLTTKAHDIELGEINYLEGCNSTTNVLSTIYRSLTWQTHLPAKLKKENIKGNRCTSTWRLYSPRFILFHFECIYHTWHPWDISCHVFIGEWEHKSLLCVFYCCCATSKTKQKCLYLDNIKTTFCILFKNIGITKKCISVYDRLFSFFLSSLFFSFFFFYFSFY